MIPNRFPDGGGPPEYTSVDATLWFVHAVQTFLEHVGDEAFVRTHLYEVLRDIIAWHERGTRHDIHVDHDGLLTAGPAEQPLTWMDAKIGDSRALAPPRVCRIATTRSGRTRLSR
jgi:predicted glycogen debranching enzyme